MFVLVIWFVLCGWVDFAGLFVGLLTVNCCWLAVLIVIVAVCVGCGFGCGSCCLAGVVCL